MTVAWLSTAATIVSSGVLGILLKAAFDAHAERRREHRDDVVRKDERQRVERERHIEDPRHLYHEVLCEAEELVSQSLTISLDMYRLWREVKRFKAATPVSSRLRTLQDLLVRVQLVAKRAQTIQELRGFCDQGREWIWMEVERVEPITVIEEARLRLKNECLPRLVNACRSELSNEELVSVEWTPKSLDYVVTRHKARFPQPSPAVPNWLVHLLTARDMSTRNARQTASTGTASASDIPVDPVDRAGES